MLAWVVSSASPEKIELRQVPDPAPLGHEAVVEVRAISLNRGEVRQLASARDGFRPGWDLSGTVVEPAADGSGPRAGARVVGLMKNGAWAERVAVPTPWLAELPEGVDGAAASTLPVAGLTALHCLLQGGRLLGRRVLVTGAAGGVGRFAVQIAALGGARVTAVARSAERARGLDALGAAEIVTDVAAGPPASFDLVLESVGGASLAAALARVAPGGTVVTFGNSSQEPTTFNVSEFYPKTGARLVGFRLFEALEREPGRASADLRYLAELLAEKKLDPQIALEASFRDPFGAMRALMQRQLEGKAVLRMAPPHG